MKSFGGYTPQTFFNNSKNSFGGYTIAEVLIVLGVTAVIFVSTITIYSGQQGRTSFEQSIQDLQSKIESYGNAVASGATPQGTSYQCNIVSGRPVLNTGSNPGLGTNENCILLGRAIKVNTNSGTMRIYTILGTRDIYNGALDTGATATTVASAHPTPAQDTAFPPNNVWLETYQLSAGDTVVSSKINSTITSSDLIGIYNSLESSGSVTALTSLAYIHANDVNLVSCIEQTVGNPCGPPPTVSQWNLCIQSGTSSQRALANFYINSSGITTKLDFASCS